MGRLRNELPSLTERIISPFVLLRVKGEERAFFAKRIVHAVAGTSLDERDGTQIKEV
jgi:hypothetical protein